MLLTLAVGAGALNTGNNLLFLLLGMMLSAIMASGILSEAILRKLELERRAPQRIFAGRPARGVFTLNNPRSYPSVNIEASEQSTVQIEGPALGLRAGEKDLPFYKFWQIDRFHDGAYVAIARVPDLEPRSERIVQANYTFDKRGLYRSPGIRLATRFPFGIFHKVRDIDAPADFLVYPRPLDAADWDADITAKLGDISRNKAGLGEEFFGLRDWRTGEDRRRIHWKSSARRNAFVVREFEDQEQRAIELILLNSVALSTRLDEQQARAIFEHHLGKIAGLLESLTSRHYAVALRTLDLAMPIKQGHAHLDHMLAHLATLTLTIRDDSTGREGLTLPASRALPLSATSHRQPLARVAIGFEESLALLPESIDLTLPIRLDDLEAHAPGDLSGTRTPTRR